MSSWNYISKNCFNDVKIFVPGIFLLSHLNWEAYAAGNIPVNSAVDAIFPIDRVDDLIKGREIFGSCGFYVKKTTSNSSGSLKYPRETSYLSSIEYQCHFSPEDLREGAAAHKAFVEA